MLVLLTIGFGWQTDNAYARVSLTDLQNQITALQGQVDALEGSRIYDGNADFQTQIDNIQLTPGPKGDPGNPGPQGEPGPQGVCECPITLVMFKSVGMDKFQHEIFGF